MSNLSVSNIFVLFFSYSKEENLKIDDPKLLQFTHLLMEQKGKYFYENEHLQKSHETLESVNCFSSIGVEYRSIFPVKIKTRPCIVILRRKPDFIPPIIEIPMIDEEEEEEEIDTNIIENQFHDNLDIFTKEDDVNDNDEMLNPDFETESEVHDDDEQNIVELELKKPTKETKQKLKKLIEKHYQLKKSKSLEIDQTDLQTVQKPSTKSNIKRIIKTEKIKKLIEKISQIDLRTICDLEKETTKQCLLKVIDEYDLD